jgi:hypothetical protein
MYLVHGLDPTLTGKTFREAHFLRRRKRSSCPDLIYGFNEGCPKTLPRIE